MLKLRCSLIENKSLIERKDLFKGKNLVESNNDIRVILLNL